MLVTGNKTGYAVINADAIIQFDLPEFTVTEEPAFSPSLSKRREKLNSSPKRLAALKRARHKIAKEIDSNSAFSLVKLRLNAGLSQAELASLMETQQPAIARLEKGQTEPQLNTILKLAEVLGVSNETVLNALVSAKNRLK